MTQFFFNNPHYYECFHNFCQLGKSLVELLVLILPESEKITTYTKSSSFARSSSLSTISSLLSSPPKHVRGVVTTINTFNNFEHNVTHKHSNYINIGSDNHLQQYNYEKVRYLLGIFIAQLSYTSTKIICTQFYSPGLFDFNVQ